LLTIFLEDVPKGAQDRPLEAVIIADSGEVRSFTLTCHQSKYVDTRVVQLELDLEVDADGKQVPLHVEL
jgi:hypothetical protein